MIAGHTALFEISLNTKHSSKPLTTSVAHYTETSQLICRANQLTGFYLRETLVIRGLMAAVRRWKILN